MENSIRGDNINDSKKQDIKDILYCCKNCNSPIINNNSTELLYSRFSDIKGLLTKIKFNMKTQQEMFIIDQTEIVIFKNCSFKIDIDTNNITCAHCYSEIGEIKLIENNNLKDIKLYLGLLTLSKIKIRHCTMKQKNYNLLYQANYSLTDKLINLRFLKKQVDKIKDDFDAKNEKINKDILVLSDKIDKMNLRPVMNIIECLNKSEDHDIQEKYKLIFDNEKQEEIISEKK